MNNELFITLIRELFDEYAASCFCGCQEGDHEDIYTNGVEEFVYDLTEKLKSHNKQKQPLVSDNQE